MLSHIRDFYNTHLAQLNQQWKTFNKNRHNVQATLESSLDPDYTRLRKSFLHTFDTTVETEAFNNMISVQKQYLAEQDQERRQPYEFYSYEPDYVLPDHRQPAPGIINLPLKYHRGQVVYSSPHATSVYDRPVSEDIYESSYPGDQDYGEPLNPIFNYLLDHKWTQYRKFTDRFCRPSGTTDATFTDFNKEQKPSLPVEPDIKEKIFRHILKRLDVTPYLPIHFVDTQFDGRPASTGTGYHNRHSYTRKAHAKYSHPPGSESRPQSKKYYWNATYHYGRTLFHKIKETGYPFDFDLPESNATDDQVTTFINQLNHWINTYPTILFTRNHISDKDGTLKVRPVYAVDELFLFMESMLTFPFMVQCRKATCSIMYGLETIRGSNHYLDSLAQLYNSFFTIDWSGFDQRLPRVITDLYYSEFLPKLIVVNHAYQPTYDYPVYPDLDEHQMYERTDNLLFFLHLWYNNMTFVLADGHAYRRTCAGVPSGLFNTQLLDSFGNLFILIDALLHFGCTDEKIDQMIIFVMGDDNSAFTLWPIAELDSFVNFLESYALKRYNMTLSRKKSIVTMLRSKIETLGYRCNFGKPRRDIGKLVAQLCYPEHGLRPQFMCSRAIGIAYASAGQDPEFHEFCKDVYHMFLPFRQTLIDPEFNVLNYVPYIFSQLDDFTQRLNEDFPSIEKVLQVYSFYHGPLTYAPKWNYAHFINSPDVVPPSAKTMEQYRQEHKIPKREIPDLTKVYY
jgi:hypothetical protein